ncbi:TIGR02444 family protein [Azospirillum sp. RU38E]|nr:TIGR02444 family protein [Azospirillum sp. RU38E]SNS12816.1 TIGR02444 family protein [Azospirillum sp. RU37A]
MSVMMPEDDWPPAPMVPAASPAPWNSLWDFSLAVYAAPGVAEACLRAQDQYGLDVNLILWAAWLGANGHRLTGPELAAAASATDAWRREVVQPLRAVRRRLKNGPPPAPNAASTALREQVQAAELEAERQQQQMLQAFPPRQRLEATPELALAANIALLLPAGNRRAVTEALHAAIFNP